MNIIKLRDEKLSIDIDMALNFNIHFRGKYAYWVRQRYIIPFEECTVNDYVHLERDDSGIDGFNHIDTENLTTDVINTIIDFDTTNKINCIEKYKLLNSFIPSNNTLNDIKNFRTWLACNLLKINNTMNDNQLPSEKLIMLKFYADNMFDGVVESISKVQPGDTSILTRKLMLPETGNTIGKMTCGCAGSRSKTINLEFTPECDPLKVYKSYIHKIMVDLFSSIEYWKTIPTEFMLLFKGMIEDIIKANLSLVPKTSCNPFKMCDGSPVPGPQEQNASILNNLVLAINDIINGVKNYNTTKKTFTAFASDVYELMQWE